MATDLIADKKAWAGTMRGILGRKQAGVEARIAQHLVNTGRMADPAALDPVAAEAERARREDMVQNLVADRSEISANVAYTEGFAISGATKELTRLNQARANAEIDRNNKQALAVGTVAGSPAQQALVKAETALTDATNKRDAFVLSIDNVTTLRADPATANGVTARLARVRARAPLSDPAVYEAAKKKVLADDPSLVGTPLADAVKKRLEDGAERDFLKQLAAPLLMRENPGAKPTDAELIARGKEKLVDIEIEQVVSDMIARRIADEVDSTGGKPRIVHPMQRTQEIEAIVYDVADHYGFTNVAHFISRHGAERTTPDVGQTTLNIPASAADKVTLDVNEAETSKTIRTKDNAATRVIAGVSPDHDAKAGLALENKADVPVSSVGGTAQTPESISIPKYAMRGDDLEAGSSQHASAKAALYMLDEGVAQAARAVRANPEVERRTLNVFTGKEDVAGDKLGEYAEPGALGAGYKVNPIGLTEPQKSKKVEPLDPGTITARLARLQKVTEESTAKVTLTPDEHHGGFTPMTVFTQFEVHERTVVDGETGAKAQVDAKTALGAAMAATIIGAQRNGAITAIGEVMKDIASKLSMENTPLDRVAIGNAAHDAARDLALAKITISAVANITQRDTANNNRIAAAAAAGTTARAQAEALVDTIAAKRDAGLKAQETKDDVALAEAAKQATAARLKATTSRATSDLSKTEADKSLTDATSHLPGPQAAAARNDLLAHAAQAGADEAAKLKAQKAADEALVNQQAADFQAARAAPLALEAATKKDAAVGTSQAQLAEAKLASKRIGEAITAAGATVPSRLTEAKLEADAELAQKEIELNESLLAWAHAEATRQLTDANLATSLARKAQEAAAAQALLAKNQHDGPPQPATADRVQALVKANKELETADKDLAEKRKARDQLRIDLAEHLPKGDPALSDPADDAAKLSAKANAALLSANDTAARSAGALATQIGVLIPGGDGVKKDQAKTKLGQMVVDETAAKRDEAAAGAADTAQRKAGANKADTARAREVLVQGEEAVLKSELDKEAEHWKLKGGESIVDYEARLKTHLEGFGLRNAKGKDATIQEMLDERMAEIRKDADAARDKNDKAVKAGEKAAADAKQKATELGAARAALVLEQDEAIKKSTEGVAQAKADKLKLEQQLADGKSKLELLQTQAKEAATKAEQAAAQAKALAGTPSEAAAAKATAASDAAKRAADKALELDALTKAGKQLDEGKGVAAKSVGEAESSVGQAKTVPGDGEKALLEQAATLTLELEALAKTEFTLQQGFNEKQQALAQLVTQAEGADAKLAALRKVDPVSESDVKEATLALEGLATQRQQLEAQFGSLGEEQKAGQARRSDLDAKLEALRKQAKSARDSAAEAAEARLLEQRKKLAELEQQMAANAKSAVEMAASLDQMKKESGSLADDATAFRDAEVEQAAASSKKLADEAGGLQAQAKTGSETQAQLVEKASKSEGPIAAAEASAKQAVTDRDAALLKADEVITSAKAKQAQAERAEAETKKVVARLGAELAAREKSDKANTERTKADLATRLAQAQLDADVGSVSKQEALKKAKLLLDLATEDAAAAVAEAALLDADYKRKTALARYDGAKKNYGEAQLIAEAKRTPVQKKLVDGWVATVEPGLKKARDETEATYVTKFKVEHDGAVVKVTAAREAAKKGGAI